MVREIRKIKIHKFDKYSKKYKNGIKKQKKGVKNKRLVFVLA